MSERRFKPVLDQSSQEESLPEQNDQLHSEWASVQTRLDHLQAAIVKLSKRSQKLQKRMQQQTQDLQTVRKDTRCLIQQVLQEQSNQLSVKQKQLQFQNMRAQIDDLHAYIKRIQKKNSEMLKEIKSSTVSGLTDGRIEDKIEERVERMMQKHQSETTRAISELRRMLNTYNKDPPIYQLRQQRHQYMRESTPVERKSSQKILSNSRSKTNIQRSAQKSYRGSQAEAAYQQTSIDHHLKSIKNPQISPRNNPNTVVPNNASSRVQLLREKLKQFQETNKKFQQKLQKKPTEGTPKGKTVQKLKDFKNYLEQSESELDQSNLDKEHNVLTDSIKNWKRGQRYRQ